jgi:hypothetical protein
MMTLTILTNCLPSHGFGSVPNEGMFVTFHDIELYFGYYSMYERIGKEYPYFIRLDIIHPNSTEPQSLPN